MAVSRFPKSWRTNVVVLRGGGRDAKGNPLPVQEITVKDCLLAPRGTAEPLDRTNGFDSSAVLYHDPEPGLVFLASDRIRVPQGTRMAGEWSLSGVRASGRTGGKSDWSVPDGASQDLAGVPRGRFGAAVARFVVPHGR